MNFSEKSKVKTSKETPEKDIVYNNMANVVKGNLEIMNGRRRLGL